MSSDDSTRITIYLPESTITALERIGKITGESINAVMRGIITSQTPAYLVQQRAKFEKMVSALEEEEKAYE